MTRARLPGIGSHQSARRQTDEWLTPPHVLAALGPFDLDPCTTAANPTGARSFYALERDDDGLNLPWEGRVWLNPPYSEVADWVRRLVEHGNGTALVFARTEVSWWHELVWPHASGILFLRGRLSFHRNDGEPTRRASGPANAGGPSALVTYGQWDLHMLHRSGLPGALVRGSHVTVQG